MKRMLLQLKAVKAASSELSMLGHQERERLLLGIAEHLKKSKKQIGRANSKDISIFKGSESLCQRLALGEQKLDRSIRGIIEVAKLPDSLGKIIDKRRRPNGLIIEKITVPLGVIGVIYESRPDVTIELTALALKTGNAIVLKGGKESFHTNQAIVAVIKKVLQAKGLSPEIVHLVDPKEDWKKDLLNADGLIDLLVPRGGEGLIKFVRENARVPVIETGAGVCHIFVDFSADLKKAIQIIVNSKVQMPSACNALDTLVVHRKIASKLLPLAAEQLFLYGVEIFADPEAYRILSARSHSRFLKKAHPEDFGHEFLSMKMAVKTVGSFDAGLKFIKENTSSHTESILTADKKHADEFLKSIDASVVIHNASLRFTDGGEFGMGAEVGISTQKIHARGPMGIDALMSYKWIVRGKGQIRILKK